MSSTPYMPLFIDAYIADTMHLTLEQSGAYLKILMVTWRHDGVALADDDAVMARILGITKSRWRERIRPTLTEFFDLSAGSWRQKRLEKEWKFVQKKAAVSRDNGGKGGRPKALKENETENPAGYFQVTQKVTQNEPRGKPPIPKKVSKKDSEETSVSSDAAASEIPMASDLKSEVFSSSNIAWLVETMGKPTAAVRTWLGKCCKQFGDALVIEAMSQIRDGPLPADIPSAMIAMMKNGMKINGSKPNGRSDSPHDTLFAGFAAAADRAARNPGLR